LCNIQLKKCRWEFFFRFLDSLSRHNFGLFIYFDKIIEFFDSLWNLQKRNYEKKVHAEELILEFFGSGRGRAGVQGGRRVAGGNLGNFITLAAPGEKKILASWCWNFSSREYFFYLNKWLRDFFYFFFHNKDSKLSSGSSLRPKKVILRCPKHAVITFLATILGVRIYFDFFFCFLGAKMVRIYTGFWWQNLN